MQELLLLLSKRILLVDIWTLTPVLSLTIFVLINTNKFSSISLLPRSSWLTNNKQIYHHPFRNRSHTPIHRFCATAHIVFPSNIYRLAIHSTTSLKKV